jgi:hypothetical protein
MKTIITLTKSAFISLSTDQFLLFNPSISHIITDYNQESLNVNIKLFYNLDGYYYIITSNNNSTIGKLITDELNINIKTNSKASYNRI